jgi:hypothetical protein
MHKICLTGMALMLMASWSAAQETPTEREAARDVVKEINALGGSLGVPAMVAKLTSADIGRDDVLARVKQLMRTELLPMSDWITQHPEIGFQETQAVAKLTAYLQAHDFEVNTPVAGLATAFVAKYKHGTPGPNLGVILEYDALRGTKGAFHGDQHSAQGPVGMAVAVALAEFLARTHTAGTVTVYGTPGEEMMPPEDRDDGGGCFQGRGHNRAQPLLRDDESVCAGLRHLLHEHRRREIHVLRRARSSAHRVERTQRARSSHQALQQHRQRTQ